MHPSQHAQRSSVPSHPAELGRRGRGGGLGEEGGGEEEEGRETAKKQDQHLPKKERGAVESKAMEEGGNEQYYEREGWGGWIPRDKEADLSSLKQPLVSAA